MTPVCLVLYQGAAKSARSLLIPCGSGFLFFLVGYEIHGRLSVFSPCIKLASLTKVTLTKVLLLHLTFPCSEAPSVFPALQQPSHLPRPEFWDFRLV